MLLSQREGNFVHRQQHSALGRLPGKTPLYAVPASPGDLAAHPGLGTVPLEHTDTGAQAARKPSKSIQQVC